MAFPDAFHFLRRPDAAAARLWAGASQPLRAALLMIAASAAFSLMGGLIRLASATLPVLEVVFFRNFFAVLLFAPLFWRHGFALLKTDRLALLTLRGAIGLVGMTAGFAGVTMIPLAEATALNFTAPLFATVLAVIILGERIRLHRGAALVLGFVGMLVVLRPGFGPETGASASDMVYLGVSVGAALSTLSALAIAVSVLIVKRLTTTETPEAIALWMVLMMTPASLALAALDWVWPSAEALFWMACLAGAGTAGHLCFTRACKIADIGQIQPLEFVKLPLSAAIGYFAFGEAPSATVWIGGALIFAAAAIITHREAVLARRGR